MVGTWLGDDYYTNHWYTVHLHVTLQIACFQFCTADITESDDTIVVFLDDKVIEFISCVHEAKGTDTEFHGVSFDATRW